MTPPAPASSAAHQAAAYIDVGRYEDAARAAGYAIAASPDDAHPWCLLARAQLGLGRGQDALESTRTAIGLDPEAEWAHRLQSIAWQAVGSLLAAVSAANEAVRLAPNEHQAHLRLAQAHVMRRDFDPAERAVQRAAALAPDEPAVWFVQGVVAAAKGHRDAAQDAFRRTLALDPDNAAAHHELARLDIRKGRYRSWSAHNLASAASGFSTAIRADPSQQVSRDAIERVLWVSLARFAYLLFLVAWLDSFVLSAQPGSAARWITVALLAIPIGFGLVFVWRLPPLLRRHLLRVATTGSTLAVTGFEVLAVVGIAASLVESGHSRTGPATAAMLAALAARIVLRFAPKPWTR